MTAADVAPVRAPGRARPRLPGRLLRLEARRNSMLWMLPPIAVLCWMDAYSKSNDIGPSFLGVILQHHLFMDIAPFAAGAAAWTGSRDGRRGTADLVSVTGRPRWRGRLVAWAATCGWALAAFAGCVAVLYGSTSGQIGWGVAQAWWVAVCGTGVLMCTTLGFAAGSFFPSRFTAPLAAACVFFAVPATFSTGYGASGGYALLSPVNAPLQPGVFYTYLPDLSIDQVLFLAGLTVALLGSLGLIGTGAGGGRWLRVAVAGVTAAGLAAAGKAFGLAGTARLEPYGVVIPALHDAASDRPIAYTPVCTSGALPICLHPNYQGAASSVAVALDPLLTRVAGLPGAPVRTAQTPIPLSPQSNLLYTSVGGSPAELYLPLYWSAGEPSAADFVGEVQAQAGPAIVDAVIDPAAADSGTLGGSPAQQAVEAALLEESGIALAPNAAAAQSSWPPEIVGPASESPAHAAAERFRALPTATQHAWLLANLSALRAGQISLGQLP